MDTETLLTDLQSLGLRLAGAAGTLPGRRGGAGPSDHAAVSVDGVTVMVPVHTAAAEGSPYTAQLGEDGAGVVERGGEILAPIRLVAAPRFYALATADGILYPKIALLHGEDVLASTVLQSCVRYADPALTCAFCAIGQSLAAGRTIARKTPEQLAEVAEAALRLDGIRQVTLTTGTPRAPDRGAAHLAACARAIKAATGLPIQAQCEPPEDFVWFERLREAGVDNLGMHLEAVTPAARAAMLPGKAEVSVERYHEAFAAAVGVFGRGLVSTYLIAGLGDPLDAIVEACARLVEIGVYPFVVPLVPIRGTKLEASAPPSGEEMRALYARVGALFERAGLRAEDTKAGCARCGACSSLSLFEGRRAPAERGGDDRGVPVPARPERSADPRLPTLAPGDLLRRARALRGHG